MKLTTIALNVVLGLALAGLVVPLALLLPIAIRGEWLAAGAVVTCVGLVFLVRRR